MPRGSGDINSERASPKNRIIEQESSMTGSTILGLGPTVDMVRDDRKAQGFLVGCLANPPPKLEAEAWALRPHHSHEECLVDSECGRT